jgi:glycosyltransferase involved in cell wall biosynthesis
MRARGVNVQFVVFDLLCSTMPQHFVSGSKEPFEQWLQVVAQSDGAVCISQAVAQELEVWFAQRGVEHPKGFKIQHFSLGSDIKGSVPSVGRTEAEQQLLERLKGQNNFLMVGTLEPRKGHAHALAAFELLWQAKHAVNLVIVGKQGWLVDALVQQLQQHPLSDKQLFWVQGASDEFLEHLYGVSRCLVVPSEGEGFGLPLIEAAHYNLPIIARDLPVFKEIAQEHAYYFSGFEPRLLAQAVQDWLVLSQRGEHPESGSIPRLTWQQSTQQLLKAVFTSS